jgi:hypothetical protein
VTFAKIVPMAFVMVARPQIISAIMFATSEKARANSFAYVSGALLDETQTRGSSDRGFVLPCHGTQGRSRGVTLGWASVRECTSRGSRQSELRSSAMSPITATTVPRMMTAASM